MYRIGLTGGIASGKSTVARILQEMGLPVINLDAISRDIVMQGTPGYREVLRYFGQGILHPNGEIDRKALGAIVFHDPVKRGKLESITHPLILGEMEGRIAALANSGHRVVVIEVPLLIEVGMMDAFDEIWLVYVDAATQMKRLQERDLLDQAGALARLRAQLPLEAKKEFADKVIVNAGEITDLEDQLERLWRELQWKELL